MTQGFDDNFTIFSDLAFRLSLQFSLLVWFGIKFQDSISHDNLLVAIIYDALSSKKFRLKIPSYWIPNSFPTTSHVCVVSCVSVNSFSIMVPSVFIIVLDIPFMFIPPLSVYFIPGFRLDHLITERSAPVSNKNVSLFSLPK